MTQPAAPQQVPPPEPPPSGFAALLVSEAAIAALMLTAYATWLGAVATAVLAGFNRYGVAPDPSAVWSTVPLWERQVDRLMDALLKISRAGWEDAAAQMGVDLPFNPTDPILADQLQRTRNLMVRTPDEVYRYIIDELGEATAAGEGNAAKAARVNKVLSMTSTENWPARAKTVSVTEVHRAYNFGSLAASLRSQRDGVVWWKRWQARDDNRVRPAHRRADGQTVPVSQPFIVDRQPLVAPGDPAGAPDNVINCRCKAIYVERGR